MIRVERLHTLSPDESTRLVRRQFESLKPVLPEVARIVADVRSRGDAAVREYTRRFDGAEVGELAVRPEEFAAADRAVTGAARLSLETAHEHLSRFHELLLPKSMESSLLAGRQSWRVGRQVVPFGKVGGYVPGGRGASPSIALQISVAARAARVRELHLATPPRQDGTVPPEVLFAARLGGARQVFKVGGAQAIAAFAFGTQTIPKVEKIVGPGNRFVTAAKRILLDEVAIDFLAGPAEILVVAEEGQTASFIAADLVAAAEQDEDAVAILLTPSSSLAAEVKTDLARQAGLVTRSDVVQRALERHGRIFVVRSLDEAMEFANEFAPALLVLALKEPREWLSRVTHAGAVSLGEYSPAALGDFCSGISHILPTGGQARGNSALSAFDFLKQIPYQIIGQKGLRALAPTALSMAEIEGLDGHARAIEIRLAGM